MTVGEFKKIKPEDEVMDSSGKVHRIFDVNKSLGMLRVYDDSWKSYELYSYIPKPEVKRGRKKGR